MVAGRPTGHGAFEVELAADGDNVFVAWADNRNRLWTAGSRDGGRTFPCQEQITVPGDYIAGGGSYSLAVDGPRVHWAWLTSGYDVMTRRSPDAGRTLEPEVRVYTPKRYEYPGVPTVDADGGVVAIVHSEGFEMPREDGSGIDYGKEPVVFSSRDGGASFSQQEIGTEANRCVGDYCAAPYGVAVSGLDVYVGWRAQGSMWLAHSTDGGAGFGTTTNLGPYLYTWHAQQNPHVDARGDTVVATWHTTSDPAERDLDPVTAFSSDRGRTFTLRTLDTRASNDVLPVAAAWGPDPQGAGFAWMSFESHEFSDTDVRFVPLSSAAPDVAVVDVRPVQATQDAARLAAGRPTTVRAVLRSVAPTQARVPLVIDLAYDDENGRVERRLEKDVLLRPGLNTLQLLAEEPVTVRAGRITATVAVGEGAADSDPSNNEGEGSRAVVQPRPLTLLFVPVASFDEGHPACRDVQDVADGAREHIAASWPVDELNVLTDCSARVGHAEGLTDEGLMGVGGLMTRLDRLKLNPGAAIDKVVGVVPQGWFSRQLIDGLEEAVGVAPFGGAVDAAIIERQNTGGWVVAHELAHQLGWTEQEGPHSNHLDDEPAPGYWTAERREIPASTRDFMHYNTAGASVTSTTGRWLSKQTWDYLTTSLSAGTAGVAATSSRTLSLVGSVSAAGTVTAGEAWELEGEPDAGDGPLTLEQLGADGDVLHTRRFGASNDLGPIGNATSKGERRARTANAAFSLRVPGLDAARRLRIRRGADVLLERTRSAAAPVVQVTAPERVELGADLKVSWTASDADGDALTHLVSLSNDGGKTWKSLGDATTATSLTVKAILELAGADVRVRVTTTDGWNTVTAESAPFAVGGDLADGKVIVDAGPRMWSVGFDGSNPKQLELGGWDRRSPPTAAASRSATRRTSSCPTPTWATCAASPPTTTRSTCGPCGRRTATRSSRRSASTSSRGRTCSSTQRPAPRRRSPRSAARCATSPTTARGCSAAGARAATRCGGSMARSRGSCQRP